MTDWMKQYPSVWVTRKYDGDRDRAMVFYGEGNKLLYQLKNLMTFRDLGQLKMTRTFTDGTVIIASSVFGHDQIIIDVSKSTGITPTCSVTLIDIPLSIPPMKWYAPGLETWEKVDNAWIIKDPSGVIEVEGVDYIKTYYSWDTLDCPKCTPIEFSVAKGEDANILTGSSPNRPFWYKSENDDGSLIYNYEGAMVPHYIGYTTDLGIVIPDNTLKHTIYSLWDLCQAQIMKNGATWAFSDAGGSYFLWKAYTEWSNMGPAAVDYFSRTGLGYMLMQAFIKNEGISLCETGGTIIKVDCCLKPEGERQAILYWESIGPGLAGGTTCTGQDFMFYGSIKICEVPSVIGPLWAMLCTPRNTKTFYVIPEVKGGCLPFIWDLSAGGGWTLVSSKPFGETAGLAYECTLGSPDCNSGVDITVTDRCGKTDTFHSQSCCENDPISLSIGYTSLVMGCNAQQTLTVWGGCPPYSWSLSGGGTLIPSEDTLTALYTSPATNPYCANNPSITLSECCGDSDQVSLVVNCNPPGMAMAYTTLEFSNATCEPWDPPCNSFGLADGVNSVETYNCDGSYWAPPCYGSQYGWWCNCALCYPPNPPGECYPGTAGAILDYIEHVDVVMGCGGWYDGTKYWNTFVDTRTTTMKEEGCCPINPLTGLPM